MADWKDQLKDLYKSYSTSQKNTKGTTSKFDTTSHANFRGKVGVNDTGIALTAKAAKRKQSNRAGYRYPQHLQNINERRRKDAMARHGITDIEDPYNKNFKPATQPADRRNYSASWGPPMDSEPKKKRANIYYDPWTAPPEPEEVIYVVPYEPRRKEPEYKSTGKFPKIDEAIAAAKKFKK